MANLKEIEKILGDSGVQYQVIDLGGEAFTVEHVAGIVGNSDEIVKTLLIKTPGENGPAFNALCLRGIDRVDFKKLKQLFGTKSEFATADEVLKIVGVPVGAVCPVGIGVPVLVDRDVLNLERVNLGSGDLTKGLEMDLKDLVQVIDYQVEDIALR